MKMLLPKYYIKFIFPVFILLFGNSNVFAGEITLRCSDHAAEIDCNRQDEPYLIREFMLKSPGVLKVFTFSGNIHVESISNSDKVRVELYVDRGYAFWSNTKNLNNYRITIIQRGNEIVASVEPKNREAGLFSDPMSFSFRIYVPVSISAALKTSAGNVTISGVEGNQMIKTGGGNIEVENISGKIAAYTSGGNIDISLSSGTIFAQTNGGNISIDKSNGEFRLKTNGGRILAEQVSGSMAARVGGGDIRAHFLHVAEGISLETSAGNIFLEVPSDSGYELLLKGSEVEFDEFGTFEGVTRSNRVEGTLKNGGPPVNLLADYGTVAFKTY